MKVKKGVFKPRLIDRFMFCILAVLHVANGVYLIGPWYLDTWDDGGKAPLHSMFNSDLAVSIYGVCLLIDGLVLLYAAASRRANRFYTVITANALVVGFLLRLYSLIGTILVLESWRPPSYLSHIATVAMCGALWVWVRVHGRPTT